jgi:hypothetical protein
MRKTCSSRKTAETSAERAFALARSLPNGFSITTRRKPGSPSSGAESPEAPTPRTAAA